MTKNEFMTKIAAGEMNEELMAFATAELEKDAAAKERARVKRAESTEPTKAQVENEKLCREQLIPQMTEAMTATQIGELLDVKTPKATAVAKRGVALGLLTVTDTKIPGKGSVKVYALAE